MNHSVQRKITGAVIALLGIGAVILTRKNGIASDASTLSKVLYSVSLIVTIMGVMILGTAFSKERKPLKTETLAAAALLTALCYIGFALFKIDIPVPGSSEKSAFHLGNTFCVVAALVLGGYWGGLSGALGMTIGDLLGGYVTSAPKTFFLKLMIGLIVGFVAHKLLKLNQETDKKKIVWKTAVSAAAGMAFNVVADPVVGYFYKRYLFGLPQDLASALAKISAGTTAVNAVVAVIVSVIFYIAIRPVLKRQHFTTP